MGHLINPIRYRLGNSIFWANNWPAIEKTRYLLSYEIHQEMDQYFRTLLFYFRKFKIKRRRKTGKNTLRKNRFPNLYFSNVNVNLFGLNLDKMMVDVNLYDFFLDNYLEEALSPQSIEKVEILPELSKFLNKFNHYVGFEFFFKHKKILQRLTKHQFAAIIKICRKKVQLLEQIAIDKLQIFIETYVEFIRRSLFSVYNDKNKIFNPNDSIFNKEKRLLLRLSYSKRIKLMHKYWQKKYSFLKPEKGSLINFEQYFTSAFYSLVTHREHLNRPEEKKQRFEVAKASYIKDKILIEKELLERNNLISDIFPARIVNKFQTYLQKTNTLPEVPVIFNPQDVKYDTFPKEIFSTAYQEKYDLNSINKNKHPYVNSIKTLDLNFCTFIKEFIKKENLNILYAISQKLKNITKISIKEHLSLVENLFLHFKIIYNLLKNKDKYNLIIPKILKRKFILNLKNFLINFKNIIPIAFYNIFYTLYKYILKFKALNYQYIKQFIKRSSTYWLKYTMDPFFQKYIAYKNLKDLYLNINIGIGPVKDIDHDIIDAKFLTLYVKRLFKQRKFKVESLQRTMYRSLCRLPYVEGFVVIFAGRFTRRESKIYKVSKKGILHFGAISKLVDYHTLGFISKFGYCAVKIMIQYKANWPTIEHQKDKRTIDYIEPSFGKKINTVSDINTKNKLITSPIDLKENSKRYTRLVQDLFFKKPNTILL